MNLRKDHYHTDPTINTPVKLCVVFIFFFFAMNPAFADDDDVVGIDFLAVSLTPAGGWGDSKKKHINHFFEPRYTLKPKVCIACFAHRTDV